MATNDKNGSDEVVEGSWSPRRSKAASAKAASAKAGSDKEAPTSGADKSADPEVLAGEIERTREELAETLDEIAERVSPKRVADRTKKKVGNAVKDGTHDAVESVKDGVAVVKDKVSGDAKTTAEVPPVPAATTGALADGALTPVEPAGAETPLYTSTLSPAAPSRLPVLAGAGAALLVLLLVLRRRRRR